LNEISGGKNFISVVIDQLNLMGPLPSKTLSVKKSVIGESSNEEYEKLINFRGI
jgi:hypothetical protein